MAKKYYAVKAGRQTGLFTSWDDCKAQVQGFSGAIYKSFPSLAEAQQYLWGQPSAAVQSAAVAQTAEQDMVAYVDGSFHLAKKMFAYGAVIFYQGEEYHFKGSDNDAELVEMRNVAGEIQGAERAMAFALEQGAAVLHIYHDYEGIARWCTGEWQAKKPGTQRVSPILSASVSKGADHSFSQSKGPFRRYL